MSLSVEFRVESLRFRVEDLAGFEVEGFSSGPLYSGSC